MRLPFNKQRSPSGDFEEDCDRSAVIQAILFNQSRQT